MHVDTEHRLQKRQNVKWSDFFGVNQIEYLGVTYEEVLKNPNQSCKDICSFCGVDVGNYEFSLDTSRYKKQGDNLNEKFANTFREN